MDGMGWDGWISPGGPRYRAPYGANKKGCQSLCQTKYSELGKCKNMRELGR